MAAGGERKVALICGGSGLIGSETARLLAKEGYQLVIHGNTQSKVDKIVAECNEISKPLQVIKKIASLVKNISTKLTLTSSRSLT